MDVGMVPGIFLMFAADRRPRSAHRIERMRSANIW
jgi:hypothetical protein